MNDNQSLRQEIEALFYRRVIVPPPLSLYRPQWIQNGDDWQMIVGNQLVAVIIPNEDKAFPDVHWLSVILSYEFPDHGWNAVDFNTLQMAQYDIEQWWRHMCRGGRYQPTRSDDCACELCRAGLTQID